MTDAVLPRELKAVNDRLDDIGHTLNNHLIEEAANWQKAEDSSIERNGLLKEILTQTTKTNGRVTGLEKLRDRAIWVGKGVALVTTSILFLLGLASKLDLLPSAQAMPYMAKIQDTTAYPDGTLVDLTRTIEERGNTQ